MTTTPSPEALALKPCGCMEVHGEDPDCPHHGEETAWAIDNKLPHDWQQRVMDLRAERDALSAQLSVTRPTPTDSGEVIQGDRGKVWQREFTRALAKVRSEATDGSKRTSMGGNCHNNFALILQAADNIEKWHEHLLRDHRLAFSRPEPVGDEALVERVALAECPVGLFWYGNTLAFKTEYGNNDGRLDAFIVESGEFFWGDAPQTITSQRAQLVTPIDTDAARAAIQAIPAPATDAGQSADSLVEALKRAALDLHEAAGRFACVSKLDPNGCSELTRERAHALDAFLASLSKSPSVGEEA